MFEDKRLYPRKETVGVTGPEDAGDLSLFQLGAALHAVDKWERDFAFVEVLAGTFLPSVLFPSIRGSFVYLVIPTIAVGKRKKPHSHCWT